MSGGCTDSVTLREFGKDESGFEERGREGQIRREEVVFQRLGSGSLDGTTFRRPPLPRPSCPKSLFERIMVEISYRQTNSK